MYSWMPLHFSFRTSLVSEDLVLQTLVWDEELYRSTSVWGGLRNKAKKHSVNDNLLPYIYNITKTNTVLTPHKGTSTRISSRGFIHTPLQTQGSICVAYLNQESSNQGQHHPPLNKLFMYEGHKRKCPKWQNSELTSNKKLSLCDGFLYFVIPHCLYINHLCYTHFKPSFNYQQGFCSKNKQLLIDVS